MEIYSDLNPDDPFGSPLIEGINCVIVALNNIFDTERDDRPFNLDIEGGLHGLLFEPLTVGTASAIYGKISTAIKRFEPRAELRHRESHVRINAQEDGYDIDLHIAIKGYVDNIIEVQRFLPRLTT